MMPAALSRTRRWNEALITLGALTAYGLAVLWPALPGLYFFPRLGVWGFTPRAGEPAILWYGWLLYAAAGGLVGAVAGTRIARRVPWQVTTFAAAGWLLLLAWHERGWFLG